MGIEKDRLIEADENWKRKAKVEDWVCQFCGNIPNESSDLPRFLEARLCAYCDSALNKD